MKNFDSLRPEITQLLPHTLRIALATALLYMACAEFKPITTAAQSNVEVIGGVEPTVQQSRSMARVWNNGVGCSGTIFSENVVGTAHHCTEDTLDSVLNAQSFVTVYNEHSTKSYQAINIIQPDPHIDLDLIILSEKIPANETVGPVIIDDETALPDQPLFIEGYGQTELGGRAGELRIADTKVITAFGSQDNQSTQTLVTFNGGKTYGAPGDSGGFLGYFKKGPNNTLETHQIGTAITMGDMQNTYVSLIAEPLKSKIKSIIADAETVTSTEPVSYTSTQLVIDGEVVPTRESQTSKQLSDRGTTWQQVLLKHIQLDSNTTVRITSISTQLETTDPCLSIVQEPLLLPITLKNGDNYLPATEIESSQCQGSPFYNNLLGTLHQQIKVEKTTIAGTIETTIKRDAYLSKFNPAVIDLSKISGNPLIYKDDSSSIKASLHDKQVLLEITSSRKPQVMQYYFVGMPYGESETQEIEIEWSDADIRNQDIATKFITVPIPEAPPQKPELLLPLINNN